MKPNNKIFRKIIFHHPEVLNAYLFAVVQNLSREEMKEIYKLLCSISVDCELNSIQEECILDALDGLTGNCSVLCRIGTGDYHL